MRYFVDGQPATIRGGLVLPNGEVVLGWAGETGTFSGHAVTAEPDPEPVPVRILSRREFRLRFTVDEQTAIDLAAMGDISVFRWRLMSVEPDFIDLGHEDTDAGVQFLVAKGLITPERAAEILA